MLNAASPVGRGLVTCAAVFWSCLVAPARAGVDFQVNQADTGYQTDPAVAADGAGNFIVVWHRPEIMARRYNAAGTPLGSEFQVNTYTTGVQQLPAVAADGAGKFVVVWESDGQFAPVNPQIFGRRFDATGSPLGAEFQVTAATTDATHAPAVASDPDGNFVVAWNSYDALDHDIRARRFDASGAPLGGDFLVNTYTTNGQFAPAVATDGDGNFVIVWSGAAVEGDDNAIAGRRFDADGVPLGGEFLVNAGTLGVHLAPDVAMDAAGSFVVVWNSTSGVLGRRFDLAGAPLGGDFQVNLDTNAETSAPSVATESDGDLLVVWAADSSTFATQRHVVGRRFDALGAGIGEEFSLAIREQAFEQEPDVAAGADADYLVAWDSRRKGAQDTSIAGRHLAPGRILGRSCLVIAAGGLMPDARSPRNHLRARRVVCQGLEKGSPSFVVGDPVTNGATLRIVANGDTPSDQTFVLPAGGWRSAGGRGFTYTDALGSSGPVRTVLLKRSRRGVFRLRLLVAGTGVAPPPGLEILPPNPATTLTVALTIDTEPYCIGFGGGNGGGTVQRNDDSAFKIRDAVTEGACP